jgi:hypothetical protein
MDNDDARHSGIVGALSMVAARFMPRMERASRPTHPTAAPAVVAVDLAAAMISGWVVAGLGDGRCLYAFYARSFDKEHGEAGNAANSSGRTSPSRTLHRHLKSRTNTSV